MSIVTYSKYTRSLEGNEYALMGIAWILITLLISRFSSSFFSRAFLPVGIAFVGKWVVQKLMAKHYSYTTRFVLSLEGILLSFFVTLITFGRFMILAIGGLVPEFQNSGWKIRNSERDKGVITASGILYTILVGYVAWFVARYSDVGSVSRYLSLSVLSWVAFFIAFWSSLPVFGMEGTVVFKWNKIVWGMLIALSAFGFFVFY